MATLTDYRQAFAREVGVFHSGTADNSSGTQTLIDLTWPIKSNLSQDDLWKDMWLFRPAAAAAGDKVRVVQSYAPSTGTLTPDLDYTNAPDGESYEIHGLIEPRTQLENLLNEGLKRCFVVHEATITPTSATVRRHALNVSDTSLSLSMASWLTQPWQVRQVGYLTSAEVRSEQDPFARPVRGEAIALGNVVYLNHPGRTFNTTDTIYLLLLKPAYYHCRASSASAFGSKADGLTAEANEAPVDVDWLVSATLVEAWKRYAQLLEPMAQQRLMRSRAEAAAWFTDLTSKQLRVPELTLRSVRHWGPLR